MNKRRMLYATLLLVAAPAALPLPGSAAEPLRPAAAAKSAPTPDFNEILATPATLEAVRAGGFVLYLRHGNTDNSRPDQVPSVDLNDCATQRPLTAEGRAVSARVGAALRQARIPIGEVRVSPLCRAKDSAAALLGPGQPYIIDIDLMYTANLTAAQKAPILANTRHLLSAPPAPGTNRLLVAHAPNLMDLIGYFPKEGTLVVFRPRGADGFEYLGSVPATRWPDLLP